MEGELGRNLTATRERMREMVLALATVLFQDGASTEPGRMVKVFVRGGEVSGSQGSPPSAHIHGEARGIAS